MNQSLDGESSRDVTPYNGSIHQSILPNDIDDNGLIALWLSLNKSPITQKNYFLDTRDFMAFTGKPIRELNLYDLQAYRHSLAGYAKASITRKLYCVKSLFSFAYETDYTEKNIGKFIKPEAVNEELADRLLENEEVVLMLALETNKRNHALLRIFYHTGIRLAELCALQWSDCKATDDGGTLRVIGKGNKQRYVPVMPKTWAELMSLPRTGTHVFMSNRKKPLHRNTVGLIVAKAAIRANIDKNVSPHWFRHTHITEAIENNCPSPLLRDSVGHASIATTNRYAHARQGHGSSEYVRD